MQLKADALLTLLLNLCKEIDWEFPMRENDFNICHWCTARGENFCDLQELAKINNGMP